MTKEEQREEFWYNYVDVGWFDVETRPKTLTAMITLSDRMPQRYKNRIPSAIVFAPSPTREGEMKLLYNLPCKKSFNHPFIYLSPMLESQPQPSVDSTVAHEFAHAILGHNGRISAEDPYKYEREADTLIASWGYRPTNSCGWMQRGKKK